MKYRIYIDEVGNSDLGSSSNPNQRYLSLSGLILDLEYVNDIFYPQMESLKSKFFKSHPDDPLIFHRKELVNKKPPFSALRDPDFEFRFNQELLGYLQSWQYTIITVVIDKLQHTQQYQTWRYDPYHYCLKVLVERFVLWLRNRRAVGDVMAESRQGKEDLRLKRSFERVYMEGSEWVTPVLIHQHLTSRELKVKPKLIILPDYNWRTSLRTPVIKLPLHAGIMKPSLKTLVGRSARFCWRANITAALSAAWMVGGSNGCRKERSPLRGFRWLSHPPPDNWINISISESKDYIK